MNDGLPDGRRLWTGLVVLLVIYAAVAAVRLAAPDDLGIRDQPRATSYMIDVVQNGNWLWPRDAGDALGSKPPLHPWLGALAARAFGGVNRAARVFPSLLGVLVTTLALYLYGRRRIGWRAAFLAAAGFLLCPYGGKMIALVRTDPLFGAVVLLSAIAALRLWERGRGWTAFWAVAVVGLLTKGPLGLVLASLGLFAVIWERHSGTPLPLRGSLVPGFAVWAAVGAGWLMLAWRAWGDEVLLEVLGRELLRHAAAGDSGELPLRYFYHAPFYLLTRTAPWSFAAAVAIVRALRAPAADDARRRFDRFLVCWILGGLVVFGLAGHQRGDLVFPLAAPTMWLAGGVLARTRALRTDRRAILAALGLTLVALPLVHWEYAVENPRLAGLRRALAEREVAREILAEAGPGLPIAFASAQLGLQIHLGIWSLGGQGLVGCAYLDKDVPAYAVVSDPDGFVDRCGAGGVRVHVLRRWYVEGDEDSFALVGTRERLVRADAMGAWFTPFDVTFAGLRPDGARSYYVGHTWKPVNGGDFAIGEAGGAIRATNRSGFPALLRLGLRQAGRRWTEEHEVAGGATLELEWPAASGGAAR